MAEKITTAAIQPRDLTPSPSPMDIDTLNHTRALALQQRATRTEHLHNTLRSSISHW